VEYKRDDQDFAGISCFYVPVDFLLEDTLKIFLTLSALCQIFVLVPTEDAGRQVALKIPNSRLVGSTARSLPIIREFRRSLFLCLISAQSDAIFGLGFPNVK
jgi:hypothetical protein